MAEVITLMATVQRSLLMVVLATAMMTATAVSACSSAVDCSLNGLCVDSLCICDSPWTGDTCGELDVLPANKVAAYGMSPNITSWGGNVVYYNGQYHLYVAEMAGDCGLHTWGRNSRVAHAVSDTILGPYVKQDVALLPWAHNPQVLLVNNSRSGSDGNVTFVLFHIGAGDNNTVPITCPPEPPLYRNVKDNAFSEPVLPRPQAGYVFHTSSSPSGPWTSYNLPFGCNNPSPWLHANGTWFVLCNNGGWDLMRASDLQGPWTHVLTLPPCPPGTGTWEDPFLFVDKRGNFHALAHAYVATQPCGACNSSLVSGHYYSTDGLTWLSSSIQPYSHLVNYTDGSSHIFSTRERPKLFFNSDGIPTHLITGVNPMTTCPPVPSVNCKTTTGIDWDFTLIQPLNVN
eukprot:m.84740 g.84740  ORF g.84740 m.84740 type:complete len:401 (+) comp14398_c0_seq1:42-1244(+)